jgi:methylated-DNA-[protein]-cysteine S-methyltransferase
VRYLGYAVEGWGVGELVFDGETLVHSAAPSPSNTVSLAEDGLAERLQAYFAGGRDDFLDVELDLDGFTSFQRALCESLRHVPAGETVTYGELAALAGRPNAPRAAGSFCAENRFAIVVPCHRVVAANGLGSYGATGVEYKRRLLELEGAAV